MTDLEMNNPDDGSSWTDDYRAGWGEGYRSGIHEGLCRAAAAVEDKLRTQRKTRACIECWCNGEHVEATQFVAFRWLCDHHATGRPPPPPIDWETKAAEPVSMWQAVKDVIRVVVTGRGQP